LKEALVELELQNRGSGLHSSKYKFRPAKPSVGTMAGSKQHNPQAKGSRDAVVEEERISLAGSDSKNTNLISYPLVIGTEILRGWGAAGSERQALLRVNFELQNIKKSLTKMRGEVDFGINKVEEVLQFLEIGGSAKNGGLIMGINEKGKEVEGGVGLDGLYGPDGHMSKRYKKKNKNKKKKKPITRCLKCDQEMGWTRLGPGPEEKQKGIVGSRSNLGLEGESSATSVMVAGGMFGKEKHSILGKYKCFRKTTQVVEPPGVLGAASLVESKSPVGYRGSDVVVDQEGGFPS
jgi:hypothetical protein